MKKKSSFWNRPHRVLTWLLCAAMLCSLAGCGGKTPAIEAKPGVTYTQLMSDMNRQVAAGLSEVITRPLWWGVVGQHIMVYGSQEGETERQHLLGEIMPESESYTYVELTLPEISSALPNTKAALEAAETAAAAGIPTEQDIEKGYDLASRSVAGVLETGDRQLYLLLEDKLQHYGLDERGSTAVSVSERAVTLCNFGQDGMVQLVVQLQIPEEYLLLEQVAADSFIAPDDTLWITAADYFGGKGCLLRFSMEDGRLLSTLTLPEGVTFDAGDITLLSDGRLLALTVQADAENELIFGNSAQLYVAEDITAETPVWSEPLKVPQAFQQSAVQFVPFVQINLIAADRDPQLQTAEGIFEWDLASGEVVQKLKWAEFGVQPLWLAAVYALQAGQYLAVTYPQGQSGACIQILTPLDPAAVAGRKIITFGKSGNMFYGLSDPVEEQVARFNAASTEYYIQVVDYAKLSEQQGTSGSNLLLNDLTHQNVPDILMIDTFMANSLLSKGLTVDLYPYLDADPELSREDFLPNILAASELGGALPSVLASFRIETLIGSSALMGEEPGWTWEDYRAFCNARSNQAPIGGTTSTQFLQMLCSSGGFIDWETRSAHFDTPDFVTVLENSAAYPEQPITVAADTKAAFEEGSVLLWPCSLTYWAFLKDSYYAFGDDCVFKGLPTADAGAGSFIESGLQLGITRYCEDPEAAWQVLRLFLLPEFQNKIDGIRVSDLPLRQDSLALAVQGAKEDFKLGKYPSFSMLDDNAPKVYISDMVVDRAAEAIQNAEVLNCFDAEIFAILREEADAFYNGVRTAEEAAAIIQNRVQTYLAEQG